MIGTGRLAETLAGTLTAAGVGSVHGLAAPSPAWPVESAGARGRGAGVAGAPTSSSSYGPPRPTRSRRAGCSRADVAHLVGRRARGGPDRRAAGRCPGRVRACAASTCTGPIGTPPGRGCSPSCPGARRRRTPARRRRHSSGPRSQPCRCWRISTGSPPRRRRTERGARPARLRRRHPRGRPSGRPGLAAAMDGPPGLRLQLVDDHPTGVGGSRHSARGREPGDARDVPDAPEGPVGVTGAARAASSENEAVTDLPRRAVTRTAKLASLPLGFAGRTALGFGKRVGGTPGGGRGRGGAGPHRRAAVQGARRAQGRGHEVRAGPEHLRGRPAGGARRPLPCHADQAPGRRSADARRDRAQGARGRARPPLAQAVRLVRRHAGRRRLDRAGAPGCLGGRPGRRRQGAVPRRRRRLDLPTFTQVARVGRMAAGWIPGLDIKPVLEELRARIVEELDYELEAQSQATFAEAFRGDPVFVVPDVVASSAKSDRQRVARRRAAVPAHRLRHEAGARSRGPPLHGVPARGTRPRRAAARRPASRETSGSLRDGRLGVLDFGAVKRLPDGMPPRDRANCSRWHCVGDAEGVVGGLREEGFIKASIEHRRRQPARLPVTVPRARAARVVGLLTRMDARRCSRTSTTRGARSGRVGLKINLPPEYLLIHRVWIGGIGVLCQIEGEVPVLEVLGQLVAELRPGRARRGARRAARRRLGRLIAARQEASAEVTTRRCRASPRCCAGVLARTVRRSRAGARPPWRATRSRACRRWPRCRRWHTPRVRRRLGRVAAPPAAPQTAQTPAAQTPAARGSHGEPTARQWGRRSR